MISDQLDFRFQPSDFREKKSAKTGLDLFHSEIKSCFVERKQVEHQYHVWGQRGQFVLLQNFQRPANSLEEFMTISTCRSVQETTINNEHISSIPSH